MTMPNPNLTTHSARKTHIDQLASTYFSSATFQPSTQLISSFLHHAHTPSYSNPRSSLERPPGWKTCWSTIVYRDEKQGQWWVPIDASVLPREIQSIGLTTLHQLRSQLEVDLKGTGCQIHMEETHNPFKKPTDDIAWSLAKYTRDKHLIDHETEGWRYRLRLTLRWTDGSWVRFRQKSVYTTFRVEPVKGFNIKRADNEYADRSGKEIEHLEYAEIEYLDDKQLYRVGSHESDVTLIGDEGKMTRAEVKKWASQFEAGKVKRRALA